MRALGTVVVLLFVSSASSVAAQELMELKDGTATVVDRIGSAILLRSDVRDKAGSGSDPMSRNDRQKYEWYFVQDSSLSLVFRKPSGIHIGGDGKYDGDIDVEALDELSAFEIRAVVFDVWKQKLQTLTASYVQRRRAGTEFSLDPNWLWPNSDLFTSVLFVARVKFVDGTILEADLEPLARAIQSIGQGITKLDLIPDPVEINSPEPVGDQKST